MSAKGNAGVYWDAALAGFGVRVYPSGRITYVVQSRGPRGSVRAYKMQRRERFLSRAEYRTGARVLDEAEADGSVWPAAVSAHVEHGVVYRTRNWRRVDHW